jgi:hypothetical protein
MNISPYKIKTYSEKPLSGPIKTNPNKPNLNQVQLLPVLSSIEGSLSKDNQSTSHPRAIIHNHLKGWLAIYVVITSGSVYHMAQSRRNAVYETKIKTSSIPKSIQEARK